MAVPIIGQDVIFTSRDFKTGKTSTNRWWAERGLIHCEDTSTGDYQSVNVCDTLRRLQAIQDMVRNSRAERNYLKPDDVANYQRYIDDMIILCQKVREQGMPNDPRHSKQKAQEWKARRHSHLVVVPGLADQM